MRFEVPQFIDVEDKIFGPLTFKQFIYLAGGGGLAYVLFKVVPFPFWLPLSVGCVVFGLMLAFYKINNRPFIEIAQSYLGFKMRGKLYIWKRSPPKPVTPVPTPDPTAPKTTTLKDVDVQKIRALAENLDILDSYQ